MGMNNTEIKKANRNSVLRYMLNTGEVSKNALARDLDMSIPTVTTILKELTALGLVMETKAMESGGGRKAMGYSCIRNKKCSVGIDITLNHINVVVINLSGDILTSSRYAIRMKNDEESYEKLKEVVSCAVEESGIDPESILGVGISLPAIVDENGMDITGIQESMDMSFDLYRIMKEKLPYPLHLQNDANSAARAEYNVGSIRETSVYFFLSQSVGGAFVSADGDIHTGQRMRAGEFGHMLLHPGERPCYCGRKGCLNAYCRTGLLAEAAGGRLEDFFEKLSAGDETCLKVWDRYLDELALSIHNLLMVFDHKVIIGGYLGQFIDPYMELLEKKILQYDPYLKDRSFLSAAQMKYEAAAVGAAAYFTEEYIAGI